MWWWQQFRYCRLCLFKLSLTAWCGNKHILILILILNKHGEADEATVSKLGAGEAAAAQANCTYLVDVWENSDLEFSQEINAQNGTGHGGLQKIGFKKFALKLDSFFNETPRGDRLPICPFENGGQMGWYFWNKGQCSVLPQYQPNTCHLSIHQSRK